MLCKNCGNDVTDMKYCTKCGTPTEDADINKNENLQQIKTGKGNKKIGLVIVCAGIVLLIGMVVCIFQLGKSAIEIMNNLGSDNVESSTPQQSNIDYDWWVNKPYKAANVEDTYLWVERATPVTEEDKKYIWFLVGPVYQDDDTCQAVALVNQETGIRVTDEYIEYINDTKDYAVIRYYPKEERVTVVSKIPNSDRYYNYSDTYLPVNSGIVTQPNGDNHMGKWYLDKYYVDTKKSQHYIHFYDGEDGLLHVKVPAYEFTVSQPEIIDSEEFGKVLRYRYTEEYGRFDFLIDYMLSSDEIIVLFTNYTYHSANTIDYSGVYAYDSEFSEKMNFSQTDNDNLSDTIGEVADNIDNYFYEGQRFECFETESGEDMILTIYLFYQSDENGNTVSEIPSMYKGMMSNGLEFWFEPYESTSECITYKIDCLDGTVAYMQYHIDSSEIELTAEEGTQYGNMYAFGGIYMALPDEIED